MGTDLHCKEIVVKTALDILESVRSNTSILGLFLPKIIIPKVKDTLRERKLNQKVGLTCVKRLLI